MFYTFRKVICFVYSN